MVWGEKLWFWVKRWWREVWSRERNYGPGSPPSPPECGPGNQTAALGQARPRQSMVQGAKLRPWVTPCPAEVWFREQNRAPGSPPAPVWSRERNCGPGSSPSPLECGLVSKTVPPGQARPRPSLVQGEKLRPRVKPVPARVWSRERNRGPGSPPAPPECGPGSQTAVLGQALVAGSVVQGEKPRPRVNPSPAVAWSREPNCGPGQARPRQSMV